MVSLFVRRFWTYHFRTWYLFRVPCHLFFVLALGQHMLQSLFPVWNHIYLFIPIFFSVCLSFKLPMKCFMHSFIYTPIFTFISFTFLYVALSFQSTQARISYFEIQLFNGILYMSRYAVCFRSYAVFTTQ